MIRERELDLIQKQTLMQQADKVHKEEQERKKRLHEEELFNLDLQRVQE